MPSSKNFLLLSFLFVSPPGFLLPTRVQIPQRARWSLRGERETDHRPSPSSRPQLEEEEERPLGTMFYGLGDSTDVGIPVTELRPCWNQQGSQKSQGPALRSSPGPGKSAIAQKKLRGSDRQT